jgi:hypothetical protein
MDFVGFGIICLLLGWNWIARRSWWAEQASKCGVVFSHNFFERLVATAGIFAIIMGLFFVGIGIYGLWTGHSFVQVP